MLNEDHTQFGIAVMADRLQRAYAGIVLANGTPAAPALLTALDVDRRIAGRAMREMLGLDKEVLDSALADLTIALHGGRHEFVLPFGSAAAGLDPGSVAVAGQQFVLDAGRPGLWPMEQVRRDAHGPNLHLLRRLIARGTRGLACKRIGLPAPFFIVETDARDLLQFPPCQEAGGVTLQCWANGTNSARFCAALPEQIEEMAESIIDDMRRFWRRRTEIACQAEDIRQAAACVCRTHPDDGLALRKIAVDVSGRMDDPLSFYLEYEGVDEAMRRGPVLDYVQAGSSVAVEGLRPPRTSGRAEDLAVLRKAGASGWIDAVSASVLAAAPDGARAILDRLASEYQTLVVFPTATHPVHCTLYWRDGVIRSEISQARAIDWVRDEVHVRCLELPATIIAGLPGRRLDEVLSLPFACPCPFLTVDRSGGGMRFKVENPASFVDLTSGRIWDDPDAKAFDR